MGVKYVKDFVFPSSGGFHGDVQRYAKGGHVTKMPAKAAASAKGMPARAKPNAPARGAPKMESKPAKGRRQGYAMGGNVDGEIQEGYPIPSEPEPYMPTEPPEMPPERGSPRRMMMKRLLERRGMSPRGEGRPVMYAKGGKVEKVMREYKEGKLHSGSKKGPMVKDRKQAIAIALSEARKAGAKIPKKAEGGIFNDEDLAYGNKKVPYRGSPKKARELGRRDRMERLARRKMEYAEKYAPGLSVDMPDRKKHGGMPVHRRKPMYGGGKC